MAYTRDLVEHLLPAVWDPTFAYGMADPSAPDPDMPRTKADPKIGGTLFAHLADIKIAWQRTLLPRSEEVAVLLRFGLDWTDAEIAELDGVSSRAVRYRVERGVGRLVAYLNGSDPYEDFRPYLPL